MNTTTTPRTVHALTLRLAALLLTLLAATPALSADRPWRQLDAEHYRVLSQLSDRETTAWTREFDQFIASMAGILRIDPRRLPPLTVMLFARDKDFDPYKLMKPNGTTANIGGEFMRRETWSAIGMAGTFDEALRQTIFHEATHWLMSVDETRQPAWFTEGIAELLSTFEIHGKDVNWARPISRHLNTLDGMRLMPLRQFLTQSSAISDRDDHTDLFYAQSWAFTHFLLFSDDPSRAQLLSRFLDTFKTRSNDATVNEVFADRLPALEKDFQSYVNGGAFRYTSTSAQTTATLPAPVPAAADTVETALGFLAMGAGRKELARNHASKAIQLNAATAHGYEILAYLAMDEKALDQAATHAEKALQGGSKDSAMFMLLAYSFARGENANRPDADRKSADLYESAITMDPRRAEPYERLAEALFNVDNPNEGDAKFLQQGLTAFPGNDWIRVGVASVAFRQNRREEARGAMNRALLPGSTLTDPQRKYAASLLQSVARRQMNEDLQAALAKRDPVAARTAIEKLLAEPDLPANMRSSLQDMLNSIPAADTTPNRTKK